MNYSKIRDRRTDAHRLLAYNAITRGGYLQTRITIFANFQPKFLVAICVDEENAFGLNKIGDLTPDTEPLSKIDSWVLLQFFCKSCGPQHFYRVNGTTSNHRAGQILRGLAACDWVGQIQGNVSELITTHGCSPQSVNKLTNSTCNTKPSGDWYHQLLLAALWKNTSQDVLLGKRPMLIIVLLY